MTTNFHSAPPNQLNRKLSPFALYKKLSLHNIIFDPFILFSNPNFYNFIRQITIILKPLECAHTQAVACRQRTELDGKTGDYNATLFKLHSLFCVCVCVCFGHLITPKNWRLMLPPFTYYTYMCVASGNLWLGDRQICTHHRDEKNVINNDNRMSSGVSSFLDSLISLFTIFFSPKIN